MITFFLTFTLLLIILGLLIFYLIHIGDDFTFLERIPISFSLSVGSISIIGVTAFLMGLDLIGMQYFVVFLFSGLTVTELVSRTRIRGLNRLIDIRVFRRACSRSGAIVFCFALSSSLLAYWAGPWLSHTADSFYHLAVVRRLIGGGRIFAENVLFNYEPLGLDLTSGTWHLVLALLSCFSGMDITRIWLYLPALLTPVYILSFHAFASTLFKNHKLAAFVTVLYFILHHKLDFRILAQPNRISLAILWTALLFTLRYLDTGKKKNLYLASVLGFVLSTMHFFTLELFLLSISSYALFRLLFRLKKGILSDSDLKRALMVIAVALVLASPFVIFKLASTRFAVGPIPPTEIRQAYREGFRHSLSLGAEFFIVDPAMLFRHPLLFKETPLPDVGARGELVLFSYLLMFFLIPACLRGKRTETFLFANMAIVPLILFNPLLLHLIVGRVPDLAVFRLAYEMPPSVLVFGFFLYQWLTGLIRSGDESLNRTRRRGERWKSRPLLAFLTGVSLFCAVSSFWGGPVVGGAMEIYNPFSTYRYNVKMSREGRLVNWEEPFSFIMNELPKDTVILSDPVSSYYIAGLTGRFIITVPLTHQEIEYEFRLLKGPEGRRDVMSVLDQNVDLKTTVCLLRKWDADYIFVNLAAPGVAPLSPQSKFDRYSPNFEKIYDKGSVSIYQYNPAVPFASWDAVTSALHSDSETKVSDDMVLASYSLDEEPIDLNQCAASTLAWRPMDEIEENRQVEFRFAGINSGHVFSETFNLVEDAVLVQPSWKPGKMYRETYFVFIPGDLPLDVYELSINLDGEGVTQKEAALGRIRLQESYEGKDFEGLTEFCEHCSGWMRYQDYAVARDLGATMSKSIRPIPPGDYQVLLTVYNHEGQGSNQVEVTLNGVSQVVGWSGTVGGEREVSAFFEGQDGGSELTITSLKREQWYIVISKVTIIPLMGGTLG
jgi:hypothetical protein